MTSSSIACQDELVEFAKIVDILVLVADVVADNAEATLEAIDDNTDADEGSTVERDARRLDLVEAGFEFNLRSCSC